LNGVQRLGKLMRGASSFETALPTLLSKGSAQNDLVMEKKRGGGN